MAVTVFGEIVFGDSNPKPLKGWPEGKIRLRIRSDDAVKAFVRTSDSIRWFYVKEENGYWVPSYEIGSNQTKTSR